MPTALKDMVSDDVIADIASRVRAIDPNFDSQAFTADLTAELPSLELKPRIAAIARRLQSGLNPDYPSALGVLVDVAKAEPAIEGFAAWPLCTFVEIFGVDHPNESLQAMEHLTKRASCEFAIRPFLQEHWSAAYNTLEQFTTHQAASVRRLASEGTRPRLPWGPNVARLTEDPQAGLDLLERLRHDPSEIVRRSVANHLNDVSKSHPRLAIDTLRRWASEPAIDNRMISHALRTLIKSGTPEAFAILGFTTEPILSIDRFEVAPGRVIMGEHIELTAAMRSTADHAQRLVVDFVIHHVAKSGGTSPKVFKWRTIDLAAGESIQLDKRRLIQMASTRTYYAGTHTVELQVAGKVLAVASFDVVV